jgi:hypothetical protein
VGLGGGSGGEVVRHHAVAIAPSLGVKPDGRHQPLLEFDSGDILAILKHDGDGVWALGRNEQGQAGWLSLCTVVALV